MPIVLGRKPGGSGGGGAPSGPAGGDLSGTYPNPAIAAGAVDDSMMDSGAAAAGEVPTADGAGGVSYAAPPGLFTAYALIRDQKAANTAGGTFTAGSWQTHDLQTEVFDPDGIVSIAANQFTLQAGTYYLDAWFLAYVVGSVRGRILNVTDTAEVALGATGRAVAADTSLLYTIKGRTTIASAKAFSLQGFCSTTNTGDGWGIQANLDSKVEIYAEVGIWREA